MIFPINEDLEYFMLTAKVTHSKQSLISQDINLVPANAKCRRTIALSVLISCLLWKLFSLSFGLCGIIVLGPDAHLIEEIIVSEKKRMPLYQSSIPPNIVMQMELSLSCNLQSLPHLN